MAESLVDGIMKTTERYKGKSAFDLIEEAVHLFKGITLETACTLLYRQFALYLGLTFFLGGYEP